MRPFFKKSMILSPKVAREYNSNSKKMRIYGSGLLSTYKQIDLLRRLRSRKQVQSRLCVLCLKTSAVLVHTIPSQKNSSVLHDETSCESQSSPKVSTILIGFSWVGNEPYETPMPTIKDPPNQHGRHQSEAQKGSQAGPRMGRPHLRRRDG